MTLTTCPDCKRELSIRADACPHCGRAIARIRKQNATLLGCLIAAVLVFTCLGAGFVGLIWTALTTLPQRPTELTGVDVAITSGPDTKLLSDQEPIVASTTESTSTNGPEGMGLTPTGDRESMVTPTAESAVEQTFGQKLDPALAARGATIYDRIIRECRDTGIRDYYLKPTISDVFYPGTTVTHQQLSLHVPYSIWNALAHADRSVLAHHCESLLNSSPANSWQIVIGRTMDGDILYDHIIHRREWRAGNARFEDRSW